MSDLDEFEKKVRATAEWQANFYHWLDHFNNGDPTDLECPGGDTCTLPPKPDAEENAKG